MGGEGKSDYKDCFRSQKERKKEIKKKEKKRKKKKEKEKKEKKKVAFTSTLKRFPLTSTLTLAAQTSMHTYVDF